MMKVYLVVSCAWLAASHYVLAWNSLGHQVVAQIAYNHLDPQVKIICNNLLTNPVPCSTFSSNFVTSSTWADGRCETWTSPQHYIDIPINLDSTNEVSCVIDPTNVVTAINQHIATLQNPATNQMAKATALRYLIHFVGDIQQPLHSSTGISASNSWTCPGGDLGGNYFTLNGTWTQLHSLWDAGGGYLSSGTASSKAGEVEAAYPYTPNIGTIPNPMTWAQESYWIARTNAYVGITRNSTPSVAYTNKVQLTTKQRMAAGGQRLADLLNTIFSTTPIPSFTGTPTNGAATLLVTFTDNSAGSITNRFWNFGDGSTTNTTTNILTHAYNAGTFSVSLTVSGSSGSSNLMRAAYIVSTCTQTCAITPPSATVCSGQSQQFCATAGMASYSWSGPGGFSAATQCINVGVAGTYTVTIVNANGCTNSCNASLAVNTSPTITCPANITVPAASGQCSSNVSFSASATGSPAPTVTCTPVSGSAFAVGTNTVNCTASNVCGTASCSFQVIVTDTEPPTIACPADVVITNVAGVCCATGVNLGSPIASDNCGVVSVISNSPSSFPIGTSTVTWTVTDTAGNSANCAQQVTVVLTDSTADSDGDGLSDLNECLIGSDPLDSGSGLGMTSVQRFGLDVKLTWRTVGGTTNIVQLVSPTGAGGSYTNSYLDLATLYVPGTDMVTTNYTDAGGATNVTQYYRIRLSPGAPACP